MKDNFDLKQYLAEGRLFEEENKIVYYRIEFKGLNSAGAKRLSNQFEKYGNLESNPNWKNYFKVGDKMGIGPKKVKQIKGRATLAFGARPDRPAETDPDAPDDALLRRLGWARRIALAEGLRATVLETPS